MAKLFCFHSYMLVDALSTHYFYVEKFIRKDGGRKTDWQWYEFSIGQAKCWKCGKIKHKHKTTLNYLPYENDGSKRVFKTISVSVVD